MAWDRFEFTIGKRFLPALINLDGSGLEPADLAAIMAFERKAWGELPANAGSNHWTVDVDDCTRFARCEVSGLMDDVADVALEFQTEG